MATTITFVLFYLSFITSLLSISVTDQLSNHSLQSTTIAPLISTTHEYNPCNNFTSCDKCMDAQNTHDISCSWIEYTSNNNTNNNTYNCIESIKCLNDNIECCTSHVCCMCLSQS
eukprot:357152_1